MSMFAVIARAKGDGSVAALYGRLRLTINTAKGAVASVFQREFLGYSFLGGTRQNDQAPGCG